MFKNILHDWNQNRTPIENMALAAIAGCFIGGFAGVAAMSVMVAVPAASVASIIAFYMICRGEI